MKKLLYAALLVVAAALTAQAQSAATQPATDDVDAQIQPAIALPIGVSGRITNALTVTSNTLTSILFSPAFVPLQAMQLSVRVSEPCTTLIFGEVASEVGNDADIGVFVDGKLIATTNFMVGTGSVVDPNNVGMMRAKMTVLAPLQPGSHIIELRGIGTIVTPKRSLSLLTF